MRKGAALVFDRVASPIPSVVVEQPSAPAAPARSSRWRVSDARYARLTSFTVGWLVVIVVCGAAVRLTGSGLGCSDWPNCSEQSLIPESDFHSLIEFGNRLITIPVGFAALAALVGAYRLATPNRRLIPWAWALVVGVFANAIWGRFTVVWELRPEVVMVHFLLAMATLWFAVALHHIAHGTSVAAAPSRRLRLLARASVLVTTGVVFLGTVVTAAGPHAGDEHVERLAVDLPAAARNHGGLVWVLVFLVLAMFVTTESIEGDAGFRPMVRTFAVVVASQGVIGYVQYFADIPELLVALHIAGACAVWILAIRLGFTIGWPRHSHADVDVAPDLEPAGAHR